MNQLDRYLARHLYRGVFLSLMVLVLLFSFGALVQEFDDVGQGRYDTLAACKFVLLTMPRRALDLLPVSTLLGSLFGLGGLAASRELVAMRALGFSRIRIAQGLLIGSIPLLILIGAASEWIAPGYERAARSIRTAALTGTPTIETSNGFWFKDGNNRVRIGSIRMDGLPADLMIFELSGKHLSRYIEAKNVQTEPDGSWNLMDVTIRRYTMSGIFLDRIDRMPWTTTLSGPELELLPQAPESLAPSALTEQIKMRRLRGQEFSGHELALWRLLARPLSLIAMLLLSLPFVFGGLRDAGLGRRCLIGGLLGVTSYVFEQAAGYGGIILDLQPAITALGPPALIATAAMILYALRR